MGSCSVVDVSMPLQIGEDWPGVFLTKEDASLYAKHIDYFIKEGDTIEPLKGLISLLGSCFVSDLFCDKARILHLSKDLVLYPKIQDRLESGRVNINGIEGVFLRGDRALYYNNVLSSRKSDIFNMTLWESLMDYLTIGD